MFWFYIYQMSEKGGVISVQQNPMQIYLHLYIFTRKTAND